MSWSQIGAYPPAQYSTSALFQAFACGLPAVCEHLGFPARRPRDLAGTIQRLQSQAAQPSEPLCVVTGQQPHWLLGPAFLLYKVASAIHAAESLSRAFSCEFSAVFWSHSDDSDVSEVDHVHAINSNWDVQRFSLALSPGRRPLYATTTGTAGADLFAAVAEALPGTGFKEDICSSMERAEITGDLPFPEHFARLLASVFADRCPRIVEPRQHRRACQRIVLRYLQELERCDDIWRQVEESLSAAQITAPMDPWKAPPFFLLDSAGMRLPVRRDRQSGKLLLDGSSFDADELHAYLSEKQSDVLPGALLRVVLQSMILPVAAYVGGNAEIAYQIFALPLFPVFDLVPPALLPRFSATVIDENMLALLERFGVEHPLKIQVEELLERVPSPVDPAVESSLAQLGEQITKCFDAARSRLAPIDASLDRSLETTALSMRDQLEKTIKRIDRVLRNRAGTGTRQARKLAAWLRPRGALQERILSGLQLLSRYGPDLPRELIELADPFSDTHRVLVHH